jgi:HEAT repeat protein
MVLLMPFGTSSAAPAETNAEADKLVKALGGEDAVARLLAEERLVAMGDEAVPALEAVAVAPGETPMRRYALNALGQIASGKAVAVLLQVLDKEEDVILRGLVCEHVGRLGVEEAVPIIGRWLATIRGKPLPRATHPVVLKPLYAWMRHAHALREIGSEKGIPILEDMSRAGHRGPGGKPLMKDYNDCLRELKKEAAFRAAVRELPGLEDHLKVLVKFCRRSDLARMRLYRMKVIDGGRQGRWVLEDLTKHPDAKLRDAASALLQSWGALHQAREATP